MMHPGLERFFASWTDYDDQRRWRMIINNPQQFTVAADNDMVMVTYKPENENEVYPFFKMDNFGTKALVELLKSQGVDADLV